MGVVLGQGFWGSGKGVLRERAGEGRRFLNVVEAFGFLFQSRWRSGN